MIVLAGHDRPARSGCEASTPVSRIATVARPGRLDRPVDLVPADLRQRPLVGVLRVVRGCLRCRAGGRRRPRARCCSPSSAATPAASSPAGNVSAYIESTGDRVARRSAGSDDLRALLRVGDAVGEGDDVGTPGRTARRSSSRRSGRRRRICRRGGVSRRRSVRRGCGVVSSRPWTYRWSRSWSRTHQWRRQRSRKSSWSS